MSDAPLPEPLANAVAVSGPHIDASADRPPDILPDHSRLDPTPPPPTTPPAAEPKVKFPQHHPYTFNSTPLRPGLNGWLVAQKTGRARRLGLVDDTGMGTHFHQLGIQTFNARIPGLPPTASDRANFVEPIIENKTMSERAIGIELAKTIKSVLLAAGQGGLRVLHTPYHKGKGDHDKRSDTVNDIGIYLDTDAARRVTTLTPHDAKKSKLTEGELESGDFGRRSWYCMAALGEVKSFSNKECAFYMQPKSSSSSSGVPPGSESTAEVEDGFSEEPHLLSTIDASHDGIGDSVDVFDREPDPLSPSVDDPDGEPYIRKPWDAEFGLGQLGDYMHNLSTSGTSISMGEPLR